MFLRAGVLLCCFFFFFFSSRRRHTRLQGDWSSDVCSSDLCGAGVHACSGSPDPPPLTLTKHFEPRAAEMPGVRPSIGFEHSIRIDDRNVLTEMGVAQKADCDAHLSQDVSIIY